MVLTIKLKIMKKFLTLFAALLIYSAAAFAQDDDMSAQAKKRFLQEEGFSPYIDDEDGSLCFKKEGLLYYIYFSGTSPVMAEFHRGGFSYENDNMTDLLTAANQVNIKKYIKCYVTQKKYIGFSIESYFNSIEDYKYTFYKNIGILDDGKDYFKEVFNGSNNNSESSSKPFEVSSIFIGNTNYDGNVITDYGKNIYSSSTQYLKPKLYIDTYKEGSYDIYVKFYSPNGLSTGNTSPNGYSYKTTLTLTKKNREYFLSGWGSSSSGQWQAGNYRIEIYYNDKLISTKYFNVL